MYSEKVKGTAPRALQLRFVLSIIYAFGGIYALMAIISKFIVRPLLEQMVYDRQLFHKEVVTRQIKLNILLSNMVSKKPSAYSLKYKDEIVPARSKAPTPEPKQLAHYESKLQEVRMLIKDTDPNNEIFNTNSQVIYQSEELIKYIRQLQYESSPSLYNLPGVEDKRTPFLKSVFDFKQEVRAVKSAILSS